MAHADPTAGAASSSIGNVTRVPVKSDGRWKDALRRVSSPLSLTTVTSTAPPSGLGGTVQKIVVVFTTDTRPASAGPKNTEVSPAPVVAKFRRTKLTMVPTSSAAGPSRPVLRVARHALSSKSTRLGLGGTPQENVGSAAAGMRVPVSRRHVSCTTLLATTATWSPSEA